MKIYGYLYIFIILLFNIEWNFNMELNRNLINCMLSGLFLSLTDLMLIR